jgi:hypothetical protein
LCDWQLENIYDIYPAGVHRYAPGVLRNTEHLFGLMVPGRCPRRATEPREHTAWQWLPYREAAQACFSPSNAEAMFDVAPFVLPPKASHMNLVRVATYNIHKGVQGLGPTRRLEIHNLGPGSRDSWMLMSCACRKSAKAPS